MHLKQSKRCLFEVDLVLGLSYNVCNFDLEQRLSFFAASNVFGRFTTPSPYDSNGGGDLWRPYSEPYMGKGWLVGVVTKALKWRKGKEGEICRNQRGRRELRGNDRHFDATRFRCRALLTLRVVCAVYFFA